MTISKTYCIINAPKEVLIMYEEKEIKYQKRKKVKKTTTFKLSKPDLSLKNILNSIINFLDDFYQSHPILQNINWKALITRFAIFFTAIFLILFTTSTINKKNYLQNSTFNNNIENISTATITYYQNNPLPKTIGESSSIILAELQKQDLIKEIKDHNNNPCDYLNSYTIITKTTSQEYRLKTYLKCSTKEKSIEEKVTCENNACQIIK